MSTEYTMNATKPATKTALVKAGRALGRQYKGTGIDEAALTDIADQEVRKIPGIPLEDGTPDLSSIQFDYFYGAAQKAAGVKQD
jgi:hypothetical protein